MYLYLIRHGEAVPENVDADRPLSEKGMLDVSEVAAFMNFDEIKVDEIWYSTKLRAKQTAAVIAEAIPHKNLVQMQGLKPNDPAAKVAQEILAVREDVVIVGHLPFLGKLASLLITGSEENDVVNFAAGGVVCLEKSIDNIGVGWEKGWSIDWMMTPDFLNKCIRHR